MRTRMSKIFPIMLYLPQMDTGRRRKRITFFSESKEPAQLAYVPFDHFSYIHITTGYLPVELRDVAQQWNYLKA